MGWDGLGRGCWIGQDGTERYWMGWMRGGTWAQPMGAPGEATALLEKASWLAGRPGTWGCMGGISSLEMLRPMRMVRRVTSNKVTDWTARAGGLQSAAVVYNSRILLRDKFLAWLP